MSEFKAIDHLSKDQESEISDDQSLNAVASVAAMSSIDASTADATANIASSSYNPSIETMSNVDGEQADAIPNFPHSIGTTDEYYPQEDESDAEMDTMVDVNSGPTRPFVQSESSTSSNYGQHHKKELIENVRHGTSVFPFASYIWQPQNYQSRVTLHWHREMELVRFKKGLFKISIDMQHTVIRDDAFLLLPGNIMHTFTLPPHCEESALVFDPKMLLLQGYDEVQSEIFEPLISGNMPLPTVITPEHPAFARIDELYNYCVKHGNTTSPARRLTIKSKLLEIISIYHEHDLISRKDVHTTVKRSKQDKLKELLNYIDSHYAGPMSIKDASQRLGVTDQYFCRFFKRVTSMSFTEYLNDLRLRRAAKEIRLSMRSISEVAFDHGFENAGYFFKSFKTRYGITPLKYRKKYQNHANAKFAGEYDITDDDLSDEATQVKNLDMGSQYEAKASDAYNEAASYNEKAYSGADEVEGEDYDSYDDADFNDDIAVSTNVKDASKDSLASNVNLNPNRAKAYAEVDSSGNMIRVDPAALTEDDALFNYEPEITVDMLHDSLKHEAAAVAATLGGQGPEFGQEQAPKVPRPRGRPRKNAKANDVSVADLVANKGGNIARALSEHVSATGTPNGVGAINKLRQDLDADLVENSYAGKGFYESTRPQTHEFSAKIESIAGPYNSFAGIKKNNLSKGAETTSDVYDTDGDEEEITAAVGAFRSSDTNSAAAGMSFGISSLVSSNGAATLAARSNAAGIPKAKAAAAAATAVINAATAAAKSSGADAVAVASAAVSAASAAAERTKANLGDVDAVSNIISETGNVSAADISSIIKPAKRRGRPSKVELAARAAAEKAAAAGADAAEIQRVALEAQAAFLRAAEEEKATKQAQKQARTASSSQGDSSSKSTDTVSASPATQTPVYTAENVEQAIMSGEMFEGEQNDDVMNAAMAFGLTKDGISSLIAAQAKQDEAKRAAAQQTFSDDDDYSSGEFELNSYNSVTRPRRKRGRPVGSTNAAKAASAAAEENTNDLEKDNDTITRTAMDDDSAKEARRLTLTSLARLDRSNQNASGDSASDADEKKAALQKAASKLSFLNRNKSQSNSREDETRRMSRRAEIRDKIYEMKMRKQFDDPFDL